MSKYTIWQVRKSGLRDYGFRSLEAIRKSFPDQPGLPREAWEPVYVYDALRRPTLDGLYMLFQRALGGTPEDFTGRSLSVSDIIETPEGDLFFCDSKGWKRVIWSEEATE